MANTSDVYTYVSRQNKKLLGAQHPFKNPEKYDSKQQGQRVNIMDPRSSLMDPRSSLLLTLLHILLNAVAFFRENVHMMLQLNEEHRSV